MKAEKADKVRRSSFILHPSSFLRRLRRSRRTAFTLIEMLTVVAILIIVLGLMVSLARFVRDRSANVLTRELLQRLDDVTREYVARTGHAPDVPTILEPDDLVGAEATVRAKARVNNAKFVELMRGELARVELKDFGPSDPNVAPNVSAPTGAGATTLPSVTGTGAGGATVGDGKPHRSALGDLPISLYNGKTLADAWGNPIVFMADQHPAIGMAPLKGFAPAAPGDRPASVFASDRERASFFFSAGPDGRYLTREDNLYSYEGKR